MKRGVTLAEVTLAIGFLTVAVLGVIAVLVGQQELQRKSGQIGVADRLAHSLLEKVRQRGYSAIVPGVYSGNLPSPSSAGFPPNPYPSQMVNRENFILNVTAAPFRPGVMQIKVEVFWSSGKTSMSTYVHP